MAIAPATAIIVMHTFSDFVSRCTAFTLNALSEAEERTLDELQTSGATKLVKALQMVQLQRVISSIGMFSLFEAILKDGLNCSDGFREARTILEHQGETALSQRFDELQMAINVLKHGRGRSYDVLVATATTLEFRIKLPGETFFSQGDVSEVSTLIEVDEKFMLNCADVIHEVSTAIRKTRPKFDI